MKTRSLFKVKSFFAFLCAFWIFGIVPTADAHECIRARNECCPQKRGEALVRRFWNSVERQDIKAYSEAIDCTFRGLNTAGIYNRDDQIAGLSSLTVTAFELRNLVSEKHGKTLVISYDFYAVGEGIVSGPSIDVWYQVCDGWKLISHSYVPFEVQ